MISRKTPRLAPLTPAAAAPDRYGPEAGLIRSLMPLAEPDQFIAANRADGRTLVGFLLRGLFQELSLQSLVCWTICRSRSPIVWLLLGILRFKPAVKRA